MPCHAAAHFEQVSVDDRRDRKSMATKIVADTTDAHDFP
jgi:hypothetical protein